MSPSQIVRELWACHEMLRRLGFSADDIFVSTEVVNPQTRQPCAGVILRTQGLEFAIHVAPAKEPVRRFFRRWTVFCERVNDGGISDAGLYEILNGSYAFKNFDSLTEGILAKGISVARPSHGVSA